MPIKKLTFILILLFFLFPVFLNADWVDNMIEGVDVDTGGAERISGNIVLTSPRIKMTPVIKSYQPFSINPPHLNTSPCGFDIFFGGFSGLNSDALVALSQGIISAAPAYAFNLALGQLCSECKTTMDYLSSLVAKFNNLGLNSCQALQMIGERLTREKIAKKNSLGKINGWVHALNERIKTLNDDVSKLMEKVSGDNSDYSVINEKVKILFLGRKVDGTPEDGNTYLLHNALVLLGICSDSSCSSYPSGSNKGGFAREIFNTPRDFADFLRFFTGDYNLIKDISGSGNCDRATITTCFTDWLTGSSTCGGCDPKRLMSATGIKALYNPPKVKPDPKIGLCINAAGLDFCLKRDLVEKKNTIIFGSNTFGQAISVIFKGCYNGGSYNNCPSDSLQNVIKNNFTTLIGNMGNTGSDTQGVAALDSRVVKYGLAPLYIAYRYAERSGATLPITVITKYSDMIGYIHVAGVLNMLISEGLNAIDTIQKNISSLKTRETLDKLCSGCASDILKWTSQAKYNLRSFRYWVMGDAMKYIDEVQTEIVALVKNGGVVERETNKISIDKKTNNKK